MQQMNWPLLGETYELKHVDERLIRQCKNLDAAIDLCIQESIIKYSKSTLADILGITNAQLSQFLNREKLRREGKKTANFPTRHLGRLMEVCGNYAPLQYLILEMGFRPDMLEQLEKLAA